MDPGKTGEVIAPIRARLEIDKDDPYSQLNPATNQLLENRRFNVSSSPNVCI
jgi:hypothetical protein